MKAQKSPNTSKSEKQKKPDLRHGMHGSLMIKGIDAAQSVPASHSDLELASPDLGVPVGQVTHE